MLDDRLLVVSFQLVDLRLDRTKVSEQAMNAKGNWKREKRENAVPPLLPASFLLFPGLSGILSKLMISNSRKIGRAHV